MVKNNTAEFRYPTRYLNHYSPKENCMKEIYQQGKVLFPMLVATLLYRRDSYSIPQETSYKLKECLYWQPYLDLQKMVLAKLEDIAKIKRDKNVSMDKFMQALCWEDFNMIRHYGGASNFTSFKISSSTTLMCIEELYGLKDFTINTKQNVPFVNNMNSIIRKFYSAVNDCYFTDRESFSKLIELYVFTK